MTKVIAITGGIGSGKTTLSEHLKKKGFLVHESDGFVSNMYKSPNKHFIDFLCKNISQDVVKKGRINKKKVAEIIFSNDKAKEKIEKYIHKQVQTSRDNFIKKNKKTKKKFVFVDIPLLLENKLEKKFDLVVSIISKKKIRMKRALKNKNFSKHILNKIIKSQTTDKERRSRSQIIINNNKTKKDFIFSAEKSLIKILK